MACNIHRIRVISGCNIQGMRVISGCGRLFWCSAVRLFALQAGSRNVTAIKVPELAVQLLQAAHGTHPPAPSYGLYVPQCHSECLQYVRTQCTRVL